MSKHLELIKTHLLILIEYMTTAQLQAVLEIVS